MVRLPFVALWQRSQGVYGRVRAFAFGWKGFLTLYDVVDVLVGFRVVVIQRYLLKDDGLASEIDDMARMKIPLSGTVLLVGFAQDQSLEYW